MDKNIVSLREIQRNYRKLINQVKRTKTPLYLGAHYKPEAVILDLESFERLHDSGNKSVTIKEKDWEELKASLDLIRKSGRQNVNLAKFIHEDRKRH